MYCVLLNLITSLYLTSDWNDCFDSTVLASKTASFTFFYTKWLKSCGLPLSLTPELNTVHQNNIQITFKVVGDNYMYCSIHLIKKWKTILKSQSNVLLLLVTILSPFGLRKFKWQKHTILVDNLTNKRNN